MENLADATAILFGALFLWSYYWNCYRKGFTMDIWHFHLLNLCFLIHFMLPFSRSDLNIFALGGLLPRAQSHVTEAYFISALGYAGVLLGGGMWRLDLGLGLRKYVAQLLEVPSQGPLLLLRSRFLLVAHGCVSITLIVIVLLYYFKLDGFGFNLRGLLLVYPALRPIAQFSAFYAVLTGSLCLARYSVTKDRALLIIVVAIASGLLFYGERSNLASMSMLVVMVAMLRAGRRLKMIWFVCFIAFLLVLSVLLNALREPGFTLASGLQGLALGIFYGNSFSDTRDFALVLSFWNGQHFYGLTYLAGLLAFIPRSLSPFRDTWSIGVVTATMAGFLPTQHPGLRPGSFGEAFLNFGVMGVLFLGMGIGIVTRFIDLRMKQALKVLPATSLKVFSYYILFMIVAALEVSANASTLYSVAVVFILSWLLLKVAIFLRLDHVGI